MYYVIVSLLVLGCVFLDQISKYLVVIYMQLHESVEVIPGILNFTYIQNRGAAFGSMADSRWIFMILSSVAIVGIFVYLFWKKPQNKLFLAAILMIVGGGIGNMIDRVRLGYVIDFIDFCAFPSIWMWVFNIADSFVCVGAGLLLLWTVLDFVRESREEKAKKLAMAQDTQNNNGENGNE